MTGHFDLLAIYRREAEDELAAAYSKYLRIDEENVLKGTAEDFLAAVIGADWKVASAPHRWAPYLYGTRRLLLPHRWPYSMIYLPEGPTAGGPVVLAFAHKRRDEGYWLDRLPPAG